MLDSGGGHPFCTECTLNEGESFDGPVYGGVSKAATLTRQALPERGRQCTFVKQVTSQKFR